MDEQRPGLARRTVRVGAAPDVAQQATAIAVAERHDLASHALRQRELAPERRPTLHEHAPDALAARIPAQLESDAPVALASRTEPLHRRELVVQAHDGTCPRQASG